MNSVTKTGSAANYKSGLEFLSDLGRSRSLRLRAPELGPGCFIYNLREFAPQFRDSMQNSDNLTNHQRQRSDNFQTEIPSLRVVFCAEYFVPQSWTKKWSLGCENFRPGPTWLLLSKTGPLFSQSLYIRTLKVGNRSKCNLASAITGVRLMQ